MDQIVHQPEGDQLGHLLHLQVFVDFLAKYIHSLTLTLKGQTAGSRALGRSYALTLILNELREASGLDFFTTFL